MNSFYLRILVKNKRHLRSRVLELVVFYGLNNSVRYQVNPTNSDSVVESVDLFLEKCALNFWSCLVNHITVHELPLTSVVVPSPSLRFLEDSDFDPPVTFYVRVQPLDGHKASFLINKLMVFNMRHIFKDQSVWYLHPRLNHLFLWQHHLRVVNRCVIKCELLRLTDSKIYVSVNYWEWLHKDDDRVLSILTNLVEHLLTPRMSFFLIGFPILAWIDGCNTAIAAQIPSESIILALIFLSSDSSSSYSMMIACRMHSSLSPSTIFLIPSVLSAV